MPSDIDPKENGGPRAFPPKPHADETDAVIGQRIRARRERIGLSQAKLGEAVGITFQQIQKYERGFNRVSASMLLKIARALGEDIGYFYEGLQNPALPVPTAAGQPRQLLTLLARIDDAGHRRQLCELARILADYPADKK